MLITDQQKNDLRNRLQFAIVLTLFFSVVFGAALKTGSQQADDFTVKWGLIIVVLIINYFFIEALKSIVWSWVISFSNLLLMVQIGSFAVIMYGLAAAQQFGLISSPEMVAVGTAVLASIVMPTVLLVVLATNALWPKLVETAGDVK